MLPACCRVRQFRHLVSDSIVAMLIVLMHGAVIMCQGMAFSVAMNSKRSSAVIALLIASNFVEIKGAHQVPLLILLGLGGLMLCTMPKDRTAYM